MTLSPDLDYLMRSLSCVLFDGNKDHEALIQELDSSAKLKSITIEMGKGDWFVFSPDEGRKCKRIDQQAKNIVVMSPLLTIQNSFNHHRACDAVIFIKKENRLIVLYLELKSNKITGYKAQFQSTRQFVRYLIGLYEEFEGGNLPIYEERYIVFHTKNINKRTTAIKGNKIKETTPDYPYKRAISDGGSLYLNELIFK